MGTLRAILLGDNAPAPDHTARLGAIEQRLDALAIRLDQTQAAARGSDVTLNTLATLQQQLEEVRQDQAQLTMGVTEELRQADDRCRMRQRRARAVDRMEMLQLRRRVYAPAIVRRVSAVESSFPAGVRRGASAASSWRTPAQDPRAAAALRDALVPGDAATAWRTVGRAAAALIRAIFALVVVLARLAAHDIRNAAAWISERALRD
ncbi:MAG TPA: hypothetical protein VF916_13230 [Ktedonobacterales bacterium]